MYDLAKFTLSEMMDCGAALRKAGDGAKSMEEAATRIARYLYQELEDGHVQRPACALVRCYKTHPFGELLPELQEFARGALPNVTPVPETRCLTLLGTAGDKPEWNTRQGSTGHKAIPLPSEQVVQKLPMVAQLVRSLGLEVASVVNPDPKLLIDLSQKTFNVFFVPDASGSPYIPAQDQFVKPNGIRSVLGFGCLIPPADMVAVILFTKLRLAQNTAELFKTLALSVKLTLLPHTGRVFERAS